MAKTGFEPEVLGTKIHRQYHYTTVDSTAIYTFVLHIYYSDKPNSKPMKANHFESVHSPNHYCQCLTLITITFFAKT